MSESVVRAVASAVTHKELTAKSTGRKFLLYTVETDMGAFTTAKRNLAEQAYRLLNRQADYTVKTEQRGEFTNYYLEAVVPVDGAATNNAPFPEAPSAPFPQAPSVPQPQVNQPQAQEPIGTPEQPVGVPAQSPTEKDIFIFRQTAAKVAGAISRTPDEFWENVGAITDYFIDGKKPVQFAEAVGAVADNDDDDIPF